MFLIKKIKFSDKLVPTIIGKSSHIKGELHAQHALRIDGTMEGDIYSQGDVLISVKSKVKANINAKRIIVEGEVYGNIQALHLLEITKTGKVYGNISGENLRIHKGAIYRGQVSMASVITNTDYQGEVLLAPQ